MKEIPTPQEVLKTLSDKEENDKELYIDDIVRGIYAYDGKSLELKFYRSLSSKLEIVLKEIFLKKGWIIDFKREHNQKDGHTVKIILKGIEA